MLLAAAMEKKEPYGRGSVAVVSLANDNGTATAVSVLRDHLDEHHQDRLIQAPLETILDVADHIPELTDWSTAFRLRYIP